MNFEDFLPPGITPVDFITAFVALAAFLVVLAVWYSLVSHESAGQAKRVKELEAKRQSLLQGLIATRGRRVQRPASDNFMRSFVERLNLMRSSQAEKVVMRLTQAGWRGREAVVRYLFFKAVLPLGFAIIAIVLFWIGESPMKQETRALISLGMVVGGFFLPDLLVRNAVAKRSDLLRKALPDALDLMVICSEAGLSLDAILRRVADEFGESSPEMADELAITSLEIGFLPDRRQALVNFINRTDQPGVRALVNSLIQSEKYGTPLAQAMRVLSQEYREERMLRAEEKAARLPALLTVPMIVFILPPLFVVLLGPAALKVIDAFSS